MARLVLSPSGQQLDLDQFIQQPGRYVGDFTLTSLQTLNGQVINLSGQEMYFAIARLYSVQTNAFRVKIYQSTTGNALTLPSNTAGNANGGLSEQGRSDLLYGTAGRPGVLPAYWLVNGAGSIIHDFTEIATAGNTIHLEYEGLRLFPK